MSDNSYLCTGMRNKDISAITEAGEERHPTNDGDCGVSRLAVQIPLVFERRCHPYRYKTNTVFMELGLGTTVVDMLRRLIITIIDRILRTMVVISISVRD